MLKNLYRHLIQIPGYRSQRKVVVIVSDDWGSIRMPSKAIYKMLIKNGIHIDKATYCKYDSLASEEDLNILFDLLISVKDKNGNPAIMTLNTIVANPDFERIKASDFKQYYYEPFTETLSRYPSHSNSFSLWQDGIKDKIIKPQFHGREHLNVLHWLKALRNDTGNIRLAFDNKLFDLSSGQLNGEDSFMDALNFTNIDEFEFQKESIIDGLNLFEKLFGFRSSTFIAPRYTWSSELNIVLKNCGINTLQSNWFQFEPSIYGSQTRKKIFHYTGQKNKHGQIYIVRNAPFEPSQIKNSNWVEDILSRARIAFRLGKPLIISTHRLNFIGSIDPSNRERNIPVFKKILTELISQYPDIEFMSVDQLGDLIAKD